MKQKIWEIAPAHNFRGIPCGGGLSEWWNWPSDGVSEVINDVNHELVNLWRVWQDPYLFSEFQRQIECVPFSRPHFEAAKDAAKKTTSEREVDRAVHYFTRIRQSMMGLGTSWAPISKARTRRNMNEQVSAWLTAVEGLPEVHRRLQRVVIECVDVCLFLRKYDCPNGLFYLDPPYAPGTRTESLYENEMPLEKHAELLEVALSLKSSVLISGYHCPLYDEVLKEWNCHEFEMASSMTKGENKPKRVEVVWTNF